MTAELLIVAKSTIYDNFRQLFSVSDHVDPATGERKIKAERRITKAGAFVSFPEAEARKLIASGHARLPTADELELRRLSL